MTQAVKAGDLITAYRCAQQGAKIIALKIIPPAVAKNLSR
jgi:hypothetical protein